jgi:hypothetical protein
MHTHLSINMFMTLSFKIINLLIDLQSCMCFRPFPVFKSINCINLLSLVGRTQTMVSIVTRDRHRMIVNFSLTYTTSVYLK